jgi:hypothetical protein
MDAPQSIPTTPTWRPREAVIYVSSHVHHCRIIGIRPLPFDRWLRVSDGKGRYEPTTDGIGAQ